MSGARVNASSDPFERHRDLLFTVAYELLGSAADAEDVLQEAWLRWSAVDPASIDHPRAYAVRIVTRLALNQLRTLSRRRESYVGPWLPEPVLTQPDVADDVVLADSVSLAMLVVLDTLGPVERAVFCLREVFGFEVEEIATMVDKSPAAVRQIAHRAREHVHARRPRTDHDVDPELVAEAFLQAARTGDVQPLLSIVAPDVVLVTDGGGIRKAALRPVHGLEKVLRFLLAVIDPGLGVERVEINGEPALLALGEDGIDSVLTMTTRAGKVAGIYVVRNPEKLAGLDQARPLRR